MTRSRDLDTPAVLIDIPRMQRNIERMQAYCDRYGLAFRPHIKTHKSPVIARIQREAGAVGIACQKLGEVEVFLDAGFEDIQLPYNIVGPHKTARLAALSRRGRITVSADHSEVLDGLEAAAAAEGVRIRVMPDLETEIERTGASPERVVALAQQIVASPASGVRRPLRLPRQPGHPSAPAGDTGASRQRRHRGAGGQRRRHRRRADRARVARVDGTARGHLHLQRHEHGAGRLGNAGRLRHERAGHGRQPPRAGARPFSTAAARPWRRTV